MKVIRTLSNVEVSIKNLGDKFLLNDKYIVDSYGNIANYATGRMLTARKNKKGYIVYDLYLEQGKKSGVLSHRVVASCFLENFSKDLQVNHIDCNKENNHYKNLEMVTNQENSAHAVANGLMASQKGQENPFSKYTDEQIHNICKFLDLGYHRDAIAEVLNVPSHLVKGIKSRKRWVHVSEKYAFNKSKMIRKYIKIPQDVVESVLTGGEWWQNRLNHY